LSARVDAAATCRAAILPGQATNRVITGSPPGRHVATGTAAKNGLDKPHSAYPESFIYIPIAW
jgi:hypothetical protein